MFVINLKQNLIKINKIIHRYSLRDNEFQIIKKTIDNFEKSSNTIFATEFMPFLKLFISKSSLQLNQRQFDELFDLAKQKYKNHQSDYQEGITRDFIDALMKAKNDSIKKSRESAPFLTDNNLAVTVNQLFLGLFSNVFLVQF